MILDRRRSAVGLEAILGHHFGLRVEILQFQGRWLTLDESSQSRLLGNETPVHRLGVNTVVGERVWDIQGFFRIRLGALSFEQFVDFLPDRTRVHGSRAASLLAQLVRFYIGPELDFDLMLVLRANEVPRCRLPEGTDHGPILGWNSWLANDPFHADAEDAAFSNADLGV